MGPEEGLEDGEGRRAVEGCLGRASSVPEGGTPSAGGHGLTLVGQLLLDGAKLGGSPRRRRRGEGGLGLLEVEGGPVGVGSSGCGHGAATIPGGVWTCRGVDVGNERGGRGLYRLRWCFGCWEVVEAGANGLLSGLSKLEFRRRLTFRKGGLSPSFAMLIALCTFQLPYIHLSYTLTPPLLPGCIDLQRQRTGASITAPFFLILPQQTCIPPHFTREQWPDEVVLCPCISVPVPPSSPAFPTFSLFLFLRSSSLLSRFDGDFLTTLMIDS